MSAPELREPARLLESPPRPSRWMGAAGAVVGVGMFLGGAALITSRAIESAAAPDAPVSTTAALLTETVRGGASWVSVVDAIEPCRQPPFATGETSSIYAIVSGPTTEVLALTESADVRSCSDVPSILTGTARLAPLSDFEGPSGFATFARPFVGEEIVVLRADGDPRLSWGEVSFMGGFALLGLVIAWFYLAAFQQGSVPARLPALAVRPALPLVPERPLRFAPRYRASPLLGIAFMGVSAIFFAGITASVWPEGGLSTVDLGSLALVLFGAGMTAVFVLLAAALVRNALRQTRGIDRPREAWGELARFDVAYAKGVDVGNRLLAYTSPFTSKPVEVTVGANEGAPWIVDGHVLVVRDEGQTVEYVVRDDGGPFALSASDLARFMPR